MSGPSLRRTSAGDLAVPFLVIGVTVYVLLRFSYDSIPPLQYPIAIPLGALAIIELVVARRVRAVVRHDPHARPMTAIAVARCVALGKATSLVAAGVAGAAVAFLGRTLPDASQVTAAAHDSRVGSVVLAVTVILTAAGLLLERAGVDPGGRDGPGRPSGRRL